MSLRQCKPHRVGQKCGRVLNPDLREGERHESRDRNERPAACICIKDKCGWHSSAARRGFECGSRFIRNAKGTLGEREDNIVELFGWARQADFWHRHCAWS